MKEYKLIQWYPSLAAEWCSNDFPIIVVEREDGYRLHPSLKGMTRQATVNRQEVEKNKDFWVEITYKFKPIY